MDKKIFLIGNAHIDPVWLWRRTEGYAEIKSTYLSALERMKEYPDYIFTSAAISYYKWIAQNEPEMFEEIKEKIKDGKWDIAGGMWVQPDCNMPSGEAFARHMLYSQRFLLETTGKKAEYGYNVDSFGHNGMMPQLLKNGGMSAYVFMRPSKSENPELPTGTFLWESPDGTRIPTFRIPLGYADDGFPSDVYPQYADIDCYEAKVRESEKISDEIEQPVMSFFGVGNHGGGPTIRAMETLSRVVGESGGEIAFSGPTEFFECLRAAIDIETLPVVSTDLQHHASGCYVANSNIKRLNRRAENELLTAEKFDWLSHVLTGTKLRTKELQTAWEKVLFNQFHDILAGCSIRSAYEEAANSFGAARDTAWEVGNFAIQRLSWRVNTEELFTKPGKQDGKEKFRDNGEGAPYVFFNPHSFPVSAEVYMSNVAKSVCDSEGRPVPFQIVRAERTNGDDNYDTMIIAEIPAFGWSTYYVYYREEQPQTQSSLSAGADFIENELVSVKFDPFTGYVTSYKDKVSGAEYAAKPLARPVVIEDYKPDTWSHNIFEFRDEIGAFCDAKLEVTECGPLRVTMRVTQKYGNSQLIQDFSLRSGSKNIEVRCKLNFAEQLKILKMSFPVNVKNTEAVYSMPYGFIRKTADGIEQPAHKWVAVENEDGSGVALLNDSKYSFDIKDNDIRMAAARGCGFADHYGVRDNKMEFQDQGEQFFSYVLMPFENGGIADVVKVANLLNQPVLTVRETHHGGELSTSHSAVEISEPNCIVEVVKGEYDGEGTVVRLYETAGISSHVKVSLRAFKCGFEVDLKPQEIKTVCLTVTEHSMSGRETNFIEL